MPPSRSEPARIRAFRADPEGVGLYASRPVAGQQTEPRWRPWRQLPRRTLADGARAALLDEGSLTTRLIRASGQRFAVHVLAQRWQRPLPDEARALGLPPAQHALVREVLLECAGIPWVYARSVLPAGTLVGELRHLRRFGARSLGALLFADPRIRREPFELAWLAPGCRLLPAWVDRPVWARRSAFRLRGHALLVQEVFLPACRLGSLYSSPDPEARVP